MCNRRDFTIGDPPYGMILELLPEWRGQRLVLVMDVWGADGDSLLHEEVAWEAHEVGHPLPFP